MTYKRPSQATYGAVEGGLTQQPQQASDRITILVIAKSHKRRPINSVAYSMERK